MTHPIRRLVLSAVLLANAGAVLAQAPKPEAEIRFRQSVMNVQGRTLGPLAQMAQDKIPFDAGVAARNSQLLEMLIALPWSAFGPGTERGAPTRADMKLWSEPAKFKEASDKARDAVGKLAAAARGSDEKAVRSAIGEVGKACKGCHDDYQLKEPRS